MGCHWWQTPCTSWFKPIINRLVDRSGLTDSNRWSIAKFQPIPNTKLWDGKRIFSANGNCKHNQLPKCCLWHCTLSLWHHTNIGITSPHFGTIYKVHHFAIWRHTCWLTTFSSYEQTSSRSHHIKIVFEIRHCTGVHILLPTKRCKDCWTVIF
jgi:hypothetical protein